MRKVDPSALCSDVRSELSALSAFCQAGENALASGPSAASNLSTLNELVFHRSYVAMETFISAYFIGCINRDASVFLGFRRNQITQSVRAKYAPWDVSHLTYSPPVHPTVADISSLLDSQDRNVTFKNYAEMIQRANDWLPNTWATKVGRVPADRQCILDAAKAIRNCIAHQSRDSFREMNSAIQALPTAGNAGLLHRPANSVSRVGAYLKAKMNGRPRTAIFIAEFDALAQNLA